MRIQNSLRNIRAEKKRQNMQTGTRKKGEQERTMDSRKENITTSEELGSEFGDINATKFIELSQAARNSNQKKEEEKRNNNAE